MRRWSTLASALAALTCAAAALATFPGSNGRLAYFYGNEIWVMNADGSNAGSLGPGLSPAWSPNGRRLVFDTVVNRNYDVWLMAHDGRARRRVTTNAAPDYFAAWSPDARFIVFTSDRGGEDLFVIGADGRNERRLTTDPRPDWGAAWSPDGSRIAFAGNSRDNLEVEVVNVDGSGRVPLTDHPERDYDPAWSPDGTRIAFTSERDGNANVYVMNADGTGVTQLTDDPAGDFRPAWSPDGSLIAFESTRDPSVFDRDVYVMNADGSNERRLRTGDVNARDVDWQPTIDVGVTLQQLRRRPFATVINGGPTAAQRVVLTVVAGRHRRTIRVGTVAPTTARGLFVTVPRTARRITVTVASWHVDPNARNNRATLFRR
jgi:Tol biopolymer transport system component